MEFAGTGLFVVGIMAALVGWIMIVIAAFRVSAGWGVGSLLIPLIALIFVVTHWQDSRRGFFTGLDFAAGKFPFEGVAFAALTLADSVEGLRAGAAAASIA